MSTISPDAVTDFAAASALAFSGAAFVSSALAIANTTIASAAASDSRPKIRFIVTLLGFRPGLGSRGCAIPRILSDPPRVLSPAGQRNLTILPVPGRSVPLLPRGEGEV